MGDYMQLDQFIKVNRADMLQNLTSIVTHYKTEIQSDPESYIEPGCDVPALDIRLCIDVTECNRDEGSYAHDGNWIFRLGLSDYDQVHSEYCAALSIGIDTDPIKLLEDLLNQLAGF
jgi:hypothetical protein